METPEHAEETRFRASVKSRREAKGWSMGELARQMNDAGWPDFHQATISRIEKGQRPVRLGEARALARVLGTEVGYMIAPTAPSNALETFWREFRATQEHKRRTIMAIRDWEESRAALRGALKHAESDEVTALLREEDRPYFDRAKSDAERYVEQPLEQLVHMAEDQVFGGAPEGPDLPQANG